MKAIQSIHDHVEFHLDNGKKLTLPITLISNSLDCVSLETIPPASCDSSTSNNKEVVLIPQSNFVRLNEKTLNNELTVHERVYVHLLLVGFTSEDRSRY